MLTRQQLFTTVAKHLLTQNAKSVTDHSAEWPSHLRAVCRYRGGDGKQCAVGCLIPDAVYDRHAVRDLNGNLLGNGLEGTLVDHLPMEVLNEVGLTDPHLLSLAKTLQKIHDREEPCDWNQALTELARDRGLSMPVLA